MAFFVTFYSFKGGVGRTLALANVAWSLAAGGKKVVMIDFDLEAPSLLDFAEFKLAGEAPKKGFLDYAVRYATDGECPPIHEYVHTCRESPDTGRLWVMPSGRGTGEGYAHTLARLSWRRLHPYKGTRPMIEGLRQALSEEIQPDYVLIDSRTGFSDVGGLSTQLLADMIVLVFNVTRGCIEGSIQAYRAFVHESSRARERIQLVASPVPQVASARGSLVDQRIDQAMEHMPGLTRPIRIFYEASLVLAEELVVRNPESFVAAERYQNLRDLILRGNSGDRHHQIGDDNADLKTTIALTAETPPADPTPPRSAGEKTPEVEVLRRHFTVVLELRNGDVVRRFGHPPYYDLDQTRGPIDLRHLEALMAARTGSAGDLGRELFGNLLGPARERNLILSRAYGREVLDPLRNAFRIRIRTDADALRALPWTLCRWRQHLLIDEGWTFELAASDHPQPVEHLGTPCRALLLAAEPAGLPRLSAKTHARCLESLLARAWNHPLKASLLHRARTRGRLAAELEKEPHLLHVYCHARQGTEELELLLEDDREQIIAVPWAELVQLLGRRPPRVVAVNTVGDCPLAPPLPGVAALIHLRHSSADTAARFAAEVWWEGVLGTDLDPVRAFTGLPEAVRRRGAVVTDYQEWKLDLSEYTPKVDRPRTHLDRHDQRRVVLEAVEDLVRSRHRRMTCLIAYGGEDNLVEHFGVQMIATLKERASHLARLERYRLELPAGRAHSSPSGGTYTLDRGGIEESFREMMGLQPSEPLAAAFREHRRGGPRTRPVHLLDWGTYGKGHAPPLKSGHLDSWIAFCHDLAGACPADVRILGYLSLISDASRHAALEEVIEALKSEYHIREFDLVALPALGTVAGEDLLRFLEDENNSSCPPAFLDHLPERIARATGGSFEAMVKLLEDTERGNRWYELDEELPEARPGPELDKDMEL